MKTKNKQQQQPQREWLLHGGEEQKITIVFHRFHDRRRVHCVNYKIEEKKRKNKKKIGIIKTTTTTTQREAHRTKLDCGIGPKKTLYKHEEIGNRKKKTGCSHIHT